MFLKLDLGDLTTIKKSVEEFLRNEQRLDVLWNNAGVMVPPKGSVTAQVYSPAEWCLRYNEERVMISLR